MKIRMLALAGLAVTLLGACAPSADRPSLAPVIIKVSEPASPGQPVTIQGRYLGGPSNSVVVFRADELGNGGVEAETSDIVSWSSTLVVVKVPKAARPGGAFVFVRVGDVLSNAMPYSVNP
jgi:IPT/TIG domain